MNKGFIDRDFAAVAAQIFVKGFNKNNAVNHQNIIDNVQGLVVSIF